MGGIGMSYYPGNIRKSVRRDFHSPVDYEVESDAAKITFKGHTINISDSGLRLCLSNPISEGQEITIKKSLLPFSCKKAVVRWVKKIDKKIYMAGLSCID